MHVVPANPCLPVPSAMTAYPARSERRHAHSSTCMRACARARACSCTDAMADAKQHVFARRDERDQDEGEPRRRPIRRPVVIPMRHMARSRTIAALARRVGTSPFGSFVEGESTQGRNSAEPTLSW
jgi:hypothetical protein